MTQSLHDLFDLSVQMTQDVSFVLVAFGIPINEPEPSRKAVLLALELVG